MLPNYHDPDHIDRITLPGGTDRYCPIDRSPRVEIR